MTIYTDRSRTLEYQRCPRARYLGYEYCGQGIAPVRLNVPLATGLYVHEGLAHLLLHPADLEGAVEVAVRGYDAAMEKRGLQVGAADTPQSVCREQRALIEALLRAYAARQLKSLLDRYQIVEVEQEDLLPLGLVRIRGEKVPLVWMARADALLLERESGDLYVQSFKTTASWDTRRSAEGDHDTQGLSEIAAIEGRLVDWAAQLHAGPAAHVPEWFRAAYTASGETAPRIMGVRMEFLVKGERREDKYNPGHWVQYSPLIRAWHRPDIRPVSGGWEYAWRWEWKEPDPETGELRTRRLGRDWQPFNIWECAEVGGIKGWIEMLDSGRIQPEAGDCLEAQFIVPVPYFRQQSDIEAWFEQASVQEARVAAAAALRRPALNRYFPQHRRSCDWPSACAFQAICFGSDQIAQDPIGSGLYSWREPHHQAERLRDQQIAQAA